MQFENFNFIDSFFLLVVKHTYDLANILISKMIKSEKPSILFLIIYNYWEILLSYSFIYEEYTHQRKRQITDSSRISSKSNFGERNIRPRKRLLSDNYLCKIHIKFNIVYRFFWIKDCDNCKKYNNGLCPQGCQTYEANRQVNSFNF